MPTPTWPFNNTDLHNIYDAIVAGGGGGDTLAGQLLDGAVDPSNLAGFYPETFTISNAYLATINDYTRTSADLVAGVIDPAIQPSGSYGFYPYYFEQIHNLTLQTNLLFNGSTEPYNLSGFYPYNIKNTSDQTQSINYLLSGLSNPGDEAGFYPSHVIEDTGHLDKIEQHTASMELSNTAQLQNTQFGDVSGITILSKTGTGFATPLAAANDLVGYMNNVSGSFYVVNLMFTDGGGVNGHSYTLLYR